MLHSLELNCLALQECSMALCRRKIGRPATMGAILIRKNQYRFMQFCASASFSCDAQSREVTIGAPA